MTTIMMNNKPPESRSLSSGENIVLTHPEALIEGENYLYLDGKHIDGPAISTVKFAGYTSCPAMVVVSNGSGQRVRCARVTLFHLTQETNARIHGLSNEPG